jgi:hypothetical protein
MVQSSSIYVVDNVNKHIMLPNHYRLTQHRLFYAEQLVDQCSTHINLAKTLYEEVAIYGRPYVLLKTKKCLYLKMVVNKSNESNEYLLRLCAFAHSKWAYGNLCLSMKLGVARNSDQSSG